MPPKDMKKALGASLKAEQDAVKNRFERAETALAKTVAQRASDPRESSNDERVVRDSFTMPTEDYSLIATIRQRCLKRGVSTTKSEVLRAGLAALNAMTDKELVEIIERLPKVKTGRPLVTTTTM
jgi:hypothetical protein